MQPIQDLLHRIQWDRAFGQARFEIGYYDRVARIEVRVPLSWLRFEPGDRFDVEIRDSEGVWHSVPLHRIRSVRRNGQLIWRRDPDR